MATLNGFDTTFLGLNLGLPSISKDQSNDIAKVEDSVFGIANYHNYSVQLCASRKLPFYSASNIDGNLFIRCVRVDNWRKDPRIEEQYQWGEEFYSLKKYSFDRGHMTRREDVQWGETEQIANEAADSTFFYTNAVPQHALLNRRIWSNLERYVLHDQTKDNGLKICVFTGPVLNKKDPFYVEKLNNKSVQIPILFWKVVYFKKFDSRLYRAGFLMSQASILEDHKLVKAGVGKEVFTPQNKLFLSFKEAATYQVDVETVEILSGITFQFALEPFVDTRSIKLVLAEVDIKNKKEGILLNDDNFVIQNIML